MNQRKPLKLWYRSPAPMGMECAETHSKILYTPENASSYDTVNSWEEWSLPLGNGYMGINVFGRTESERVQISESTLFNPARTKPTWPESNSIPNGILGGYNNFSETFLDFGHTEISNYTRDLDLDTATAHVDYTCGGVDYHREYFVSYPDRVIVLRITASQPGALSFTLRPTIPFVREYNKAPGDGGGKTGTVTLLSEDTILLGGTMEFYQIHYEGQVKVLLTGTQAKLLPHTDENGENATLEIVSADSAVILIATGTNYKMESRVFTEPDPKQKLAPYPHPHALVSELLTSAAEKGYEALYARHIADYQNLFHRTNVDLGGEVSDLPTDELLEQYRQGKCSRYLEELYFQYGRYLLIASSREHSTPANLQGVWNCYNNAPWSSGYWHNINVQMNYWPAFNTNLAETFEPYVDYFKAYVDQAEQHADTYIRENYPEKLLPGKGANGWIIGTGAWLFDVDGIEMFGHSGPGTGAFTSILFWDYYEFTKDRTILRETAYPAVSSMARFLSKVLVEEDGKYLTKYSASPEQLVNGKPFRAKGCAFDQQMIYENHKATLQAAKLLGIRDELTDTIEEQIDKLEPVLLGADGQIKEFREETHYGDIGEWHHRHISHLVGLYPGTLIHRGTPEWLNAAKTSLEFRGDKSTGWAIAHRLNAWARIGEGNRTHQVLRSLLQNGTLPNLWDTHPPFQIDGNFGGTSGIAEMLLQSHSGAIELLPCLPDVWAKGSFQGLVARGNFEISAQWTDKTVTQATLHSRAGEICRLVWKQAAPTVTDSQGTPIAYTQEADVLVFPTHAGEIYTIR